MDYIMLGQRISHYRRERRLTQEQLAERADLSHSFLGHIERGSRIPSLETVLRLYRALDVTPNDLLADEWMLSTEELPERITVSPRRLMHGIALLLHGQEAQEKEENP